MRRIIGIAVLALGLSALLQAQVRIPGAINTNESCCAIGMRGPSVPANSHRLVVSVTGNQGARDFRHDGMRHDGFRHDGHRDRFRNNVGGFGYGGGYLYNPYGYYDTQTTEEAQPAATNYEQPVDDSGPGLTVFERRREYQLIGDSPQYQREQQEAHYGEHYTDAREDRNRTEDRNQIATNKNEREAAAPAAAPEEVVSTILIFRDGSHREIKNYALMGTSIYDLSVKPGQGRMKILLADLDIPATIAANDQRGIEFKVPKQ
jgi:hypothetical protein